MIMDSWRRHRVDNSNNQEVSRTRSHNRKPPLGNWHPTVPLWEKKFCTVVGSVPWRKVVDSKKFMHLYADVLKWNDLAGEEAFLNAKNRYWAAINGLPCDLSLPDPDIHIDEIDWDSDVDPELLLDLERESISPANQENGEPVVILGELLNSDNLYSMTGWGDAEDGDVKKADSSPENKGNSWEDDCAQAKESVRRNGWGDDCNDDPWGGNQGIGVMKATGWGDGWNDSWGGNQVTGVTNGSGWDDGCNDSWGWNQWEKSNYESGNLKNGRNSGGWEPSDANQRYRECTGGRYKTSRFHGDNNNLTTREWRNGKGSKRVSFGYEQRATDMRQSNLTTNSSCAPVRRYGSSAMQGDAETSGVNDMLCLVNSSIYSSLHFEKKNGEEER